MRADKTLSLVVLLIGFGCLSLASCSAPTSHLSIVAQNERTISSMPTRTTTPLLWLLNGGVSMEAFDLAQIGNTPPARIVDGPNTFGDLSLGDLAGGPQGEIYVFGNVHDSHGNVVWQVDRFPARANGDTPPTAVINCDLLAFVSYIAAGPHGELAVTGLSPQQQLQINLIPSNSNGCPSGLRSIAGSNTGLTFPQGLAIGSQGAVYVLLANNGVNSIEIFGRTRVGNVAPDRVISGPHTHLFGPSSMAVDHAGYIYVANQGDNSVIVYRPSANGDAVPVRRIHGTNTQLYEPVGLAIASDGRLFVDDTLNQVITVYAAGADDNAAPIQVIGGSATGIQGAFITISPN